MMAINIPCKTSPQLQRGLSLVEIMVALLISLFMLGGVVQVYFSNKTTYAFSTALGEVQDNARFALEILNTDIRMAGFWGCASLDPNDTENITNNLNIDSADYSESLHDFVGQPAIEAENNDGLNNSDTFTIRGSKPGSATIREPYNTNTSANIFIDAPTTLEDDDIVLLSNCEGTDIFQISNINDQGGGGKLALVHNTGNPTAGTPGNYNPNNCGGGNAHCLSQTYGGDASIISLQTVTYSIALGADGTMPALWRSENGNNEEMVEGVEQMQILFGVDSDDDGTPDQYMPPDPVNMDTSQIVAMRLMLLMVSSDDFVLDDNQNYTFNSVNTTAEDRRLRQVFTSTIALRNRIGQTN